MLVRDTYYKFDDRCFQHPGVVVDLGCLTWDWSKDFFGKKKVIGFDAAEDIQPEGAELRRVMVMPYSGKAMYHGDSAGASVVHNRNLAGANCDVVSLDSILAEFGMASIIKMNIEGSEYPLLFSLKHPPCDQLIVSFHDFHIGYPYPKILSEIVRNYLSVWYDWTITFSDYSWWMGLLKDEHRRN